MHIIFLLFLSLTAILAQDQSTCPNATLRALTIDLPTDHQGIWVAPFNTSNDVIAVLITNVAVDNGSRFYVVNASASCPSGSQLQVETHFNAQYQFSQLYVVDALDEDYFASLLYERATGLEYIGMFQKYSHGPDALYSAGIRTRIGQDLELVCRPCIIAGLMTGHKTWAIQQINFLSQKVFYNYTLPYEIDDIYLLNMEQDSAAGQGLSSYFLTLAAIYDSGNTIQLMELNMGNNSVIFTANYTAANPIESLNSYYGEVFSITTVDYKLQFIDMTNGSVLQQFTLGYASDLVADCAIFYPNIACRSVRFTDSQLVPTPFLTFWTYQLPTAVQPIQVIPTCLGSYTVTDDSVKDLVAYPGFSQFIIATQGTVYIYLPTN